MSESFHSSRFNKTVWLTNHAIESMAKRNITLSEIKTVIENGEYQANEAPHGWIYHHFSERSDNLICVAIVDNEAIIMKTVMINWKQRSD